MAKFGLAKKLSDPPNIPFGEQQRLTWYTWLKALTDVVNNQAMQAVSTIALGASPFVYQWTGAGEVDIGCDGHNTQNVEFSRDGTTWYSVNGPGGMYRLSQGDYLRFTYTTTGPTLVLIPR